MECPDFSMILSQSEGGEDRKGFGVQLTYVAGMEQHCLALGGEW